MRLRRGLQARGDQEHVIEQRLTAGVGVGAFRDGLGAVLDAVADGITVQDADGRIVYANAAAAELIGFPDAATLVAAAPGELVGRFELRAEDGTPLPLTALPGRRALAGERPPPVTVRFRIPATGEERWSIVRASPLLDANGAPTHAINAFQDITARILAEREARDAALRSRQLVESLPVIAWVADAHGRLEAVNARWWQYAGNEAPEDARDGGGGGEDGLPIDLTSLVHVDDRPRLAEAWEHALATGEPLDETVRLVRADGASRWHVVRGVPAYDGAGAIGGWIGTSTDIDEAKRAADRSRLVAAASERLDESLDPDGTVRAAGAIAVPDLADVCVIDLLAEDGTTTRAAIVVGDPRYQAIADALMDYPSIPGTGGLMGSVFASGRSTLVEDVTDDTLLARTKDRRHADILRDLGIRSAIAVPLAARGQVLGAMALIHGWSGRRYRADDVPLVEELARRVGLALANARLYVAEQDARRAAEHERDRIQRLQRLAGQLAEASSVAAWRRWCSPRPAPPSTRPRAASTSSRPMATPWRSSSPTATCPVSSTSSGASRSRRMRRWPPPRAPARRCGCRTSASCAPGLRRSRGRCAGRRIAPPWRSPSGPRDACSARWA